MMAGAGGDDAVGLSAAFAFLNSKEFRKLNKTRKKAVLRSIAAIQADMHQTILSTEAALAEFIHPHIGRLVARSAIFGVNSAEWRLIQAVRNARRPAISDDPSP